MGTWYRLEFTIRMYPCWVLLLLQLAHSLPPEDLPQFFGASDEIPAVPRKTWSDVVKDSCKKGKRLYAPRLCNDVQDRFHFQHLASLRHPVVIAKAPPTMQWPAFRAQRWKNLDPKSRSNLFVDTFGLTKMTGVQKSKNSPIFVYEERNRLLGKTTKYVKNKALKKIAIKGGTFFNRMDPDNPNKGYYYYSRSLPAIEETMEVMSDGSALPETGSATTTSSAMDNIAHEFAPQSMFNVTYTQPTRAPSATPSPIPSPTTLSVTSSTATIDMPQSAGSYLWLSGPGITASCHYDRSHNFFVQVSGAKRFYLWSPLQLKELYIYPFYHPRDRQSQFINLEWNERSEHSYPLPTTANARVPAYSIDLKPGDVLYVPPYWAHRVTSLTSSVSINTWSPGEELHVGSLLNSIGLPKGLEGILNTSLVVEEDRKNRKHASGVAAVFVREVLVHTLDLLSTVDGKKKKKQTQKSYKIYNTKFQPTTSALKLIQTLFKARYSPIGHLWQGCLHFEPNRCPRTVNLSESERMDTAKKVHQIVQSFQPLVGVPYGIDVAEMILKDYVERLATFVAGVEGSCMYLRCIGEQYSFVVVA